jgi:hypothetical protein
MCSCITSKHKLLVSTAAAATALYCSCHRDCAIDTSDIKKNLYAADIACRTPYHSFFSFLLTTQQEQSKPRFTSAPVYSSQQYTAAAASHCVHVVAALATVALQQHLL